MVAVPFTPLLSVTVIIAVPGFTVCTNPTLFTFATDSLSLFHLKSVLSAFSGFKTIRLARSTDSPAIIFWSSSFIDSVLHLTAVTFTNAFTLYCVTTVIVAVPSAFAVTIPLPSTDIALSLSLAHLKLVLFA